MTRWIPERVAVAGRSIGLYGAGSLAAGVIGFAALPFFTRIFKPDDFGVIGLFTAAIGLIVPVMSLSGYIYVLFDHREPGRSSGVPEATIMISTMSSAVIALLFGIMSWAGVELEIPWLLVALGLVTAWSNVWVALRLHLYQADDQPMQFFYLSAAPPAAAFLSTLLFSATFDNWTPRVMALASVAALAAAWSAVSLRRLGRLSLSKGFTRMGDVARFGSPLMVHTASIWVVGFTDRFIVADQIDLTAAGIYTVAYSIGLGISSAHDGVSRHFVAKLRTWVLSTEGRNAASRFSYGYTLVALLTLPLVVVAAQVAMRLLASDSFQGGGEFLIWLVPAQTLAGIARVYSGFLYVEQRTAQRAALSLGEATINVALTIFAVQRLGAIGAAIATFVTYLLSSVGTYLLARRGGLIAGPRAALRSRRDPVNPLREADTHDPMKGTH